MILSALDNRLLLRRSFKVATLLIMLFSSYSISADEKDKSKLSGFRVVGYLPDYRQFNEADAEYLTDLIVFSAEPMANGELDVKRLSKVSWPQLVQAKQQHHMRLILCVGGWERSANFAIVAGSAELRSKFVASARRLCLEKQLDGIDLDWEHPKDAAEQNGYAQLLRDLHVAFQPSGLSVSVTMAAWQVIPRKAFESVDWIQVMAYDHPGRHSTLQGAQADLKKLIEAGASPNKISLGVPFYGRGITNADRTLTFREIVTRFKPAADVDEVDGVYFNGPLTIQRKVQYAQQAGLAGVMIWELGQDAPGNQSLLQLISKLTRTKKH